MALSFTATLLLLASTARSQYNTKEIKIDQSKHDEQFFSFRSRPDIEAPKWQSKVYNQSALAPGYWFVSPYGIVDQTSNEHSYVAPVIYDSNGELVWNGGREVDYFNIFSLKVARFNGQNMLSYLQPAESQGVIMNSHYAPVRHVRVGTSGFTGNMHDFQIVDDGTKALYMTNLHKNVSPELSRAFDYDGNCDVIFAGIEERDLETDEILFQWSSEGHIGLRESYVHPVPEGFSQYNCTTLCYNGWGVDYIHGNSVEKLPDGDYLMSARHMSTLYKISHIDGSIVWRLGGKKSDFTLTEGTHFSAQHDARCLSQNETHMTISIMDNAVGVWEAVGYHSNPNSRGLVMSLNLETMEATEIAHYDHPDGVGGYAFERGNVQTLPNGNVFITWTLNAQHSEYTADGTLIAEAKFFTELKTYRSYKFPWIGHRSQKPDVHSEVVIGPDGELRTVVYVSWNGDTQAARWSLYETDASGGKAKLLNTTRKTGFETTLSHEGYYPFIKVDAMNAAGALVEKSESAATQTVFLPEADSFDKYLGIEPADDTDYDETLPTEDNEAPEQMEEDVGESPSEDSPTSSAWKKLEDIPLPRNSVMVFLGGIICGALLLLGVRMLRCPNVFQRLRRKRGYSALGVDDEEKRRWSEDGLLRESDEDIDKTS